MKIIEIDEDLYQYIATQAQSADESASDILRRLLLSFPAPIVQHLAPQAELHREETVQEDAREEELNDDAVQSTVSQSAVENSSVLAQQAEDIAAFEAEKESEQPLSVHIPPVSEAVIQQTVNKVRQLLNSAEFQQESRAVSRFLALLKVLYQNNPDSFAQATEQEAFQGRSRTYFAADEATLLAAGNHTKPKQIPDTPYWVITNNNSARKMLMLERTMQFMQLPENLINEVRTYFTTD